MPTAHRPVRTSKASRRNSPRRKATARAPQAARGPVAKTLQAIAARVLPAGPHDAVKLLEKDHRRFEKLLGEGEETTARANKRRVQLLTTLAAELALHEQKEEKVLYPALKRHRESRDIVLEGYQEHHVADVLVHELEKLDPGDERWGAKFKVLKESLEHHIREEEGKMFKTARSVLGRDRLEQLGVKFQVMTASRARSKRTPAGSDGSRRPRS